MAGKITLYDDDYFDNIEKQIEKLNANPNNNENNSVDDEYMAISKDLLDAKLEVIETRMDGRIAAIEATVNHMNQKIDTLSSDIKSFRFHIISTVIVTAIATVVAIASFNATVLGNMVASFESGKSTSEAITKATIELGNQQAELKQIQQDMIRQSVSAEIEQNKPKKNKSN